MTANSKFKLTGDTFIEPCNRVQNSRRITNLIVGPTGSGKSTFIEALAGDGQSLGLSKDQLTGFTQEINAYELKHAQFVANLNDNTGQPVYLIDTPGFSDSKMSELEIINKVQDWMSNQNLYYISRILYLCPITDTRITGTKWRTIKMLQSLLQKDSAASVVIVTTMWDMLSNLQAKKRAEAHFAQLRDEIWKGLLKSGAQIVRFQNTRESALGIIGAVIEKLPGYPPFYNGGIITGNPAAGYLYRELLVRITNSHQEKQILRLEKLGLIAKPNIQLESVVIPRLQELNQYLIKYMWQVVAFGTPPAGYESVPELMVSQYLLDCVEEAHAERYAIELALVQIRQQPGSNGKSLLHSRLQDVQVMIIKLAKYVDASGRLVRSISGDKDIKKVLCVIGARITMVDRARAEVALLRRRMIPWE